MERLRAEPGAATLDQGLRYAAVGLVVAFVYLLTTTLLTEVFAIAFQIALASSLTLAVLVHFTLQRRFVWRDRSPYALARRQQVIRYLIVVAVQYLITAASTSLLPGFVGLPVLPIYFVTIGALGATNFMIFRSHVFHYR